MQTPSSYKWIFVGNLTMLFALAVILLGGFLDSLGRSSAVYP
jgi:hypothetical protein